MKSLLTIFISFIFLAFVSSLTIDQELRMRIVKDTNPIFLNETYYTGFLPIDTRGSLFFWLFESRSSPSTDPLVVWLTGGPGCASEIAIFAENGPYKINLDNTTLSSNPYSWNNASNVLYVDQPLGTGFSTASIVDSNETQIAQDFYTFLQEFVGAFPDYKGRDFYIIGESYGGHYIPAISANIVRQGGLELNFKGLAIGNGLVSVYYQYPQYAEYAYQQELINEDMYKSLQTGFELCDSLIKINQSEAALLQCQTQFERIVGKPPRFNVYDVREPCSYPPLCYDLSFIDSFIEQISVENILGVTGRPWEECNSTVHVYLALDFIVDFADDLAFVTDSGLKVMLYHGDQDFICNWMGGEALANNLHWKGLDNFRLQNYTSFETYGSYRSYENFVFLRVFNAGHMVPMDQPQAALAMLQRFLGGW